MSFSAVRPPAVSVRRYLGLVIGIALLHRALMVATANNLGLRANLNDFFNLALSLSVSIGMFYVAYRFRDIWHIRVAWTLLGGGISLVTVGAIIYVVLMPRGWAPSLPSQMDSIWRSTPSLARG